ncbi:Histidine biosynthesis bifunctional protein hisIE [Arachis hypogaea]|nr:Histidine biosynthesis bifunctional protein hisIE [Arachis hypogaea]
MTISYAHMLRFSTSFFNGKLSFTSDNKGRRTQLLPFASLKRPDNNIIIDPKVDSLQDGVKWDDKGLAVAIARNVDTGAILMQGFANREAVFSTLSSRKATFFSRSLSTLWTKGETSNNYINIHDVFLDCDRESVKRQMSCVRH